MITSAMYRDTVALLAINKGYEGTGPIHSSSHSVSPTMQSLWDIEKGSTTMAGMNTLFRSMHKIGIDHGGKETEGIGQRHNGHRWLEPLLYFQNLSHTSHEYWMEL